MFLCLFLFLPLSLKLINIFLKIKIISDRLPLCRLGYVTWHCGFKKERYSGWPDLITWTLTGSEALLETGRESLGDLKHERDWAWEGFSVVGFKHSGAMWPGVCAACRSWTCLSADSQQANRTPALLPQGPDSCHTHIDLEETLSCRWECSWPRPCSARESLRFRPCWAWTYGCWALS